MPPRRYPCDAVADVGLPPLIGFMLLRRNVLGCD